MKSIECLKIYDQLSARDRKGASILTLSRETKVPIPLVRKYLTEFSKAFVKVGGTDNYATNRFHPTLDHRKRLIADLAKYKADQLIAWWGVAIFCSGVAIFISITSFNGL